MTSERLLYIDESRMMGMLAQGDLFEYTSDHADVISRIEEAREENEGRIGGIIASLDYADVDHVLLQAAEERLEEVFRGIAYLKQAFDLENACLYFPEEASSCAEREDVKRLSSLYEVKVKAEFPDKRREKGLLWVHMLFAAELASLAENTYRDGIYISVNGKPVEKISADTMVSSLLEMPENKGKEGRIRAGYRYIPASKSQAPLRDLCIGNGILQELGEGDCVIQDVQRQLDKYRRQSCGKCVFCREGLIQLEYMTQEITGGRGKTEFESLYREIGEAMAVSNYCTLGQQAPLLVLSTLNEWGEEYGRHIKQKKCTAGVCFSESKFYIDPHMCTGCTDCIDVCHLDCIEGRSRYIHMIDEMTCDGCGKCMEVCPENAVISAQGKVPRLPDKLTKVGKFKSRR